MPYDYGGESFGRGLQYGQSLAAPFLQARQTSEAKRMRGEDVTRQQRWRDEDITRGARGTTLQAWIARKTARDTLYANLMTPRQDPMTKEWSTPDEASAKKTVDAIFPEMPIPKELSEVYPGMPMPKEEPAPAPALPQKTPGITQSPQAKPWLPSLTEKSPSELVAGAVSGAGEGFRNLWSGVKNLAGGIKQAWNQPVSQTAYDVTTGYMPEALMEKLNLYRTNPANLPTREYGEAPQPNPNIMQFLEAKRKARLQGLMRPTYSGQR